MEGALLASIVATIRLATPLVIGAMGELVAERSGVLNIGIEGMMLLGAFVAFAVAAGSGSILLGVGGAVLAGTALASLFALFVLVFRADPIVCGAALNIFALGASGTAYRVLYPPEKALVGAPQVADLVPGLNGFVVLAALLVVAVVVFLSGTRTGLAVRAVGERADAAHSQGVSVLPIRWGCTLFGGACAGLAGSTLVLWISDSFVEGMTSGRGFIALVLVLFGGYRAGAIVAGALLFGAASALGFRLQAMGLEVPYNLLLMLPYLLTLLVLAVFAARVHPPADLARPFRPRD